ncbi:hypothetical protein BU104_12615 [Staphylococcus xylosus]|uniref:Uncharacterized protein n=2 Tax=Staphylococcus xylosus TaxID=1288 RepID=A0AAQ0LX02_STAXY|nr:hypothetical protein BU104_12615 [Staphylococcus xylosus]
MKIASIKLFMILIIDCIAFVMWFISMFKINGDFKSIWFYVFIICIFIMGVCLVCMTKVVGEINKIYRIKDINSMLKTLKYSENEIEERQKYLNSLSEDKVEEIKLKLENKISEVNKRWFYNENNNK